MTGVGVLLGTAAYMSPEQAKGRPADKRSDIWAFGCVLYEMLTGKRAFDAEDITDTLAAILMREPDWSALPATVPPAIRTLIRRCVEKNPRKRIPDASVALFAMEDLSTRQDSTAATTPQSDRSRPSAWRWMATHAVALLLGITATGAAVWLMSHDVPRTSRFAITPALQP
jgi:serine/threonine protein kinase